MNVNLATRLNVISFLQKFFLIWFGIWEKSLFFETFFCFFLVHGQVCFRLLGLMKC